MPGRVQSVGAHPLRNLLLSALAGMVIGIGLTVWWVRADSGFAVHVLGSGTRVSVLISHDHRHVLIASGSSGPEFSDALDSALSTVNPGIDLLLIDPAASADVAERARALDADLVLMLPGDRQATVGTLDESISVPFSNSESLRVVVFDETWYAIVETPSGPLLVASAPGGSPPPAAALLIALDRDATSMAGDYPAVVGPPGDWADSIPGAITVRGSESIEITIDGDRIRVPTG